MKRILITLLMLLGVAYGQTVKFVPEGPTKFNYQENDSGFLLKPADTSLYRAPNTFAQIRYKSSNHTFYGYYLNCACWRPLATDSAGIIVQLNLKVDSVVVTGDSLFWYNNHGVSHGYVFPISSTTWRTFGNTATDASFIGTNNAQYFRINANGEQRMVVSTGGDVGIGIDTPLARLDIVDTSSGVLIPRMTTAQRDAISAGPRIQNAMLIYNTTTSQFNYWNGSAWIVIATGGTITWQNALTAGSTLTTNNAVTNDAHTFTMTGDASGYRQQIKQGSDNTMGFYLRNTSNADIAEVSTNASDSSVILNSIAGNIRMKNLTSGASTDSVLTLDYANNRVRQRAASSIVAAPPTLTANQIGVGNGSNQLSSSSALKFTAATPSFQAFTPNGTFENGDLANAANGTKSILSDITKSLLVSSEGNTLMQLNGTSSYINSGNLLINNYAQTSSGFSVNFSSLNPIVAMGDHGFAGNKNYAQVDDLNQNFFYRKNTGNWFYTSTADSTGFWGTSDSLTSIRWRDDTRTINTTGKLALMQGTTALSPLQFTNGAPTTSLAAGNLMFNTGLLILDSTASHRDTLATRNWVRNNSSASSGLTIGTTTISGATDTYLLYNNAGVLGQIDPSTLLSNGNLTAAAGTAVDLGGAANQHTTLAIGDWDFNVTSTNADIILHTGATDVTQFGSTAANVTFDDGNRKCTITASNNMIVGSAAIQFSAYGAGALTTDGSGNITAVSDERMKRNIKYSTTGLNEVIRLKPITFKYNPKSKLDTVQTYSGFSAQNVKANIPYGTGKNSDGYLTLQDRAILGAAINAIKELKALNNQQQSQIDAQRKELNALKKMIKK